MRGWILLFLSSLILPFSCVVDSADGDVADDADATSIVKVGDRIPVFSVEMVDNGQRSVFSSEQLSGPTMIVFFHTGCSDCQRELPLVEAWWQSLDDQWLRRWEASAPTVSSSCNVIASP